MGKFKFFTSGGIQNETTFSNNNLHFDSSELCLKSDVDFKETAFRFNLDAVESPYGKFNIKQIVDLSKRASGDLGIKENQTRLTYSTPKFKILKKDENFKGQIENRTTIKYDEKFNYTQVTNSLRPKLLYDAKGLPLVGNLQLYSALKIDTAKDKITNKCQTQYNGALIGAEKTFGKSKRFSGWLECHMPGKISQLKDQTTLVAGVGVKLWK